MVTADVTVPRGSLLYVDARLNVTIPSFTHSMLLKFKLHQKTTNDYDVSWQFCVIYVSDSQGFILLEQ